MKTKNFTCFICGETKIMGWTNAEANDHARKMWGVTNATENKEFGTACVDCAMKHKTPEEFKMLSEKYKNKTMKRYKIVSPVTNIIAKEEMREDEIREHASLLVQNPGDVRIWKRAVFTVKIEKVIEWLTNNGYKITEL